MVDFYLGIDSQKYRIDNTRLDSTPHLELFDSHNRKCGISVDRLNSMEYELYGQN